MRWLFKHSLKYGGGQVGKVTLIKVNLVLSHFLVYLVGRSPKDIVIIISTKCMIHIKYI